MALFLTGATGYIGSYIAEGLLRNHKERLALLVRAKSEEEAAQRLWRSMQLHMPFDEFLHHLHTRIDLYLGDLTDPGLGLERPARDRLVRSTEAVIHCAASLNRKSEKACLNVNLRGTLEVLKVAMAARDHHGLRRFSDVSTVAVAGRRHHENVSEEHAIDWDRSDYDPYARTKKFCELMVHELLPDVPVTVFRPSIVLGDSRFARTTQFDMVRAFVLFARLRILPFRPDWRLDIVPADYVGRAIVALHQKDAPKHGIYHLSSGAASPTYREILDGMARDGFNRRHTFLPALEPPFRALVNALASTPRTWGISPGASLVRVFLPYLTFDTVFDNTRVKDELGEAPVAFTRYAYALYRFAREGRFTYPYVPWRAGEKAEVA
jgi:thioester reductase-like protein